MGISQAASAGCVGSGRGMITRAAPREISLRAATPDDTGANSLIGQISRSHRLGGQNVLKQMDLQQKNEREKWEVEDASWPGEARALREWVMGGNEPQDRLLTNKCEGNCEGWVL